MNVLEMEPAEEEFIPLPTNTTTTPTKRVALLVLDNTTNNKPQHDSFHSSSSPSPKRFFFNTTNPSSSSSSSPIIMTQQQQQQERKSLRRKGSISLFVVVMVLLVRSFLFLTFLEEEKEDNRQQKRLKQKQLQIKNFIQGNGLALSIHITHHAGTTLCDTMRQVGLATPEFACMKKGKQQNNNGTTGGFWPPNTTEKFSWNYEETSKNIERLQKFFQFISWEYGPVKGQGLHSTNWEHQNLVSMIIMRHPLDRFLARGKCGPYYYPKDINRAIRKYKIDPKLAYPKGIPADPTNDTLQDLYWGYANSQCADNYALRVLSNRSNCVNGSNTPLECLEGAKNLLRRFTFIIDQDCLEDSLVALGKELHLPINKTVLLEKQKPSPPPPPNKKFLSAKERLNNDTLYEFLLDRFRRDIELYEWSKTQSIVRC